MRDEVYVDISLFPKYLENAEEVDEGTRAYFRQLSPDFLEVLKGIDWENPIEKDLMAEFVQECCELDPRMQIPEPTLYQACKYWADTMAIFGPFTHKMLAQDLERFGVKSASDSDSESRKYLGVSLNICFRDEYLDYAIPNGLPVTGLI